MAVTRDDLRRLIDAGPENYRLVLEEGKAKVTDPTDEVDSADVEIINRDELVERLPAEYSDTDLDQLATTLDATVGDLGA
ncbi:hypothetical protein [Rhodococcus sp. X156]|uniref:hypothetical protein n=1 Tax=Rhodococcus sp. X156 TaxID=2499145 RepID=UPI000FD7E9E0|nr:hypothetical protein [Rhodococcus sp. X156]